jgi:hypothetical protein
LNPAGEVRGDLVQIGLCYVRRLHLYAHDRLLADRAEGDARGGMERRSAGVSSGLFRRNSRDPIRADPLGANCGRPCIVHPQTAGGYSTIGRAAFQHQIRILKTAGWVVAPSRLPVFPIARAPSSIAQ